MAKRSKSNVNKSQAIRDYVSSNPGAKPKEIAVALAAQGVDVTPAFVSTLKSNAKRNAGKVGRRGRPRAAAGDFGIESLVQAKKLADKMGGVAQARQALNALAKILAE